MLLEMRYIPIQGVFYNVCTMEEYSYAPDVYNTNNTAILNNGYCLPIRSNGIGIDTSCGNMISRYTLPETEEEKSIFSSENMIDMSNPKSYADVILNNEKMRDAEREVLTTVDNITVPNITEKDTAAMAALKQAIIDKHCDLDKYSCRFGSNYTNEKRLLKENSISLKKLTLYGNALDIKMTLTLEDESPNVPNPMGTTITIPLTGGDKYGSNEGDGE